MQNKEIRWEGLARGMRKSISPRGYAGPDVVALREIPVDFCVPDVVFGVRSNGRARGSEIFLFPLLQFLSSYLHSGVSRIEAYKYLLVCKTSLGGRRSTLCTNYLKSQMI